jgi:hypothetical protein
MLRESERPVVYQYRSKETRVLPDGKQGARGVDAEIRYRDNVNKGSLSQMRVVESSVEQHRPASTKNYPKMAY